MSDPNLVGLRKAVRVTAVAPPLFAIGLALGGDTVGIFAVFGSFVALGFVDFSGPPMPRARAYVLLAVVGVVVITIGTLASVAVVPAVITVAVLGSSSQIIAVFGGYWNAAARPMVIVLVLAVMVGDTVSALDQRLAGWLLAGAVSTIAALVLFPVHERRRFRHQAADACEALERAVAREGIDRDAALARARNGVRDLRAGYLATPLRPAGPAGRDRAFLGMLDALEHATDTAERAVRVTTRRPDATFGDAKLRDALSTTFAQAAVALRADDDAPREHEALRQALIGLDDARRVERARFESGAWAPAPTLAATSAIVAGFDEAFPARVLSLVALNIGANVMIVTGDAIEPGTFTGPAAPTPTLAIGHNARTIVAAHLSPRSACCRAGIRTGLALAAAVALAKGLDIDHSFWVVLGVLVVLRSSAPSTAATAVEALFGTMSGFGVVALLFAVVGDAPGVLWAVLVISVFLATYMAATVTGDVAQLIMGQAAFTLFVVVLFDILEPEGWRSGLVRVEDVALGASVAMVLGLLVWPRGARAALKRSLAELLTAAGAHLDGAYRAFTHADGVVPQARLQDALVGARRRAHVAYSQALSERHGDRRDLVTSVLVIDLALTTGLAADITWSVPATMPTPAAGGRDLEALSAEAATVVAEVDAVAHRLAAARADGVPPAVTGDEPADTGQDVQAQAVLAAAARDLASPRSSERVEPAAVLALVWVSDWLRVLHERIAGLRGPISALAVALERSWWR